MKSNVLTSFEQIDLNGIYTYADYLTWQFEERLELIKGRIFKMSPAPSRYHQKVSGNLHGILFQKFNHESCNLYAAPFDVRLPVWNKKKPDQIYTVVQPDICIICDRSKLDDAGCNGAPDLIIEILSPGNSRKEMKEKFEVYEESKVKEYWLVNTTDRHVIIYTLEKDRFIGLKPFVEEEDIHSPLFPGLKMPVEDIFKD